VSELEVQKPTPRTGLSGLIAKHPAAWLTGALAVVFLLLGTGAVFAGAAVGSNGAEPQTQAVAVPDAEQTATATPTADPGRAVPAALPAATRLRTCSVAGPASDSRLMNFKATS
jgi:D-alanyl-D-alanine carboxypeptidase/D-alanyl-D-alanine-endopeptidase (penicillin-binding protein 4)